MENYKYFYVEALIIAAFLGFFYNEYFSNGNNTVPVLYLTKNGEC